MTVPPASGVAPVIARVLALYGAGDAVDRADERAAVKASLALLRAKAPGHSVEVRIPPYAAVQVIEGIRHRRGTPPAVVECDARTWLQVASGQLDWSVAHADGRLRASGERSDLSAIVPIHPLN